MVSVASEASLDSVASLASEDSGASFSSEASLASLASVALLTLLSSIALSSVHDKYIVNTPVITHVITSELTTSLLKGGANMLSAAVDDSITMKVGARGLLNFDAGKHVCPSVCVSQ